MENTTVKAGVFPFKQKPFLFPGHRFWEQPLWNKNKSTNSQADSTTTPYCWPIPGVTMDETFLLCTTSFGVPALVARPSFQTFTEEEMVSKFLKSRFVTWGDIAQITWQFQQTIILTNGGFLKCGCPQIILTILRNKPWIFGVPYLRNTEIIISRGNCYYFGVIFQAFVRILRWGLLSYRHWL